jgi:hypothetical protein
MTRKLYKVFVYEPFVRPARKFGKKMSYRQKHPEDDLTLPRALSREAATDDALRSLAATSRNVKQGQPASANSTAEPAVRSRQEQN